LYQVRQPTHCSIGVVLHFGRLVDDAPYLIRQLLQGLALLSRIKPPEPKPVKPPKPMVIERRHIMQRRVPSLPTMPRQDEGR